MKLCYLGCIIKHCTVAVLLGKRTAIALCLIINSSVEADWLPSLSANNIALITAATEQRATNKQHSRLERQFSHELGLQILMIEAKEQKNRADNAELLAEVFVFDYLTGNSSLDIVNATNGTLYETRRIAEPHLPLNQAEIQFVTNMVQSSSVFIDRLEQEYQHQFGRSLPALSQLNMKVAVWNPAGTAHADSHCTTSRCAYVSVFTSDYFNFSVEPVVDLVSKTVFLDLLQ